MLFNSYIFIFAFLPLTLLGFHLLKGRAATAWLVTASLFFYGWWNPLYLGLLFFSMIFNYGMGYAQASSWESRERGRRRLLIPGIILNLALLGWFKYALFAVETVNHLGGTDYNLHKIILPLAISFFTFQQIAYLVDSYRGLTREYNFMDYCLFVTFFPQLIAGPIVHHSEMLPQFAKKASGAIRSNMSVGLSIFIIGLFKKVVLADTLAEDVSPVFGRLHELSPGFLEAWGAALAYTLQLYFDFSGYSDMAIGLGRMFGIRLPMNFNSPYRAPSIIEFWRRWHITLSRFLKDYLYIPLGGNRNGAVRRHFNLILTMLLGGLWHGAGWTFFVWGGLHGLYLVINHFWRKLMGTDRKNTSGPGRIPGIILTFLVVVIAWVFFRAKNINEALVMLKSMMGLSGFANLTEFPVKAPQHILLGLLIVFFLPNTMEIMRRFRPVLEKIRAQNKLLWIPSPAWALGIGLLGLIAFLRLSHESEFLYFQF